jgi:uncharacterized protein
MTATAPGWAATVLWQGRQPELGAEYATVEPVRQGTRLSGTVVAAENGPVRVEYTVVVDPSWRTRRAVVTLADGATSRTVELVADGTGAWWRSDGTALPHLAGCLDVDVSFTPATNTLPLRRLDLAVGSSADVPAAWVAPDLDLQVLHQSYARVGELRYRYRSPGFEAAIEVDEHLLVTDYEGLWVRTAASAWHPSSTG